MTEKKKRTYGYIKSKEDPRDLLISFKNTKTSQTLKTSTEKNNDDIKPILIFNLAKILTDTQLQALSQIDQGELGSCTANAIAYAYAFDEIKQKNSEIFLPSRLFIYYNERLIEGTVDSDSGAELRDGMKVINQYGVCDEHLWIYDPTKFAVKPPDNIYREAKKAKAIKYYRIDLSSDQAPEDRVNHLKRALINGFPFVFGIMVYESFESDQVAFTGIVPMPQSGEQLLGGHAVCAVGFDDTQDNGYFIVKNSWGPNWGINGYFYLPYGYVADPNLASEFWIVQTVTNPKDITNYSPNDIFPDAQNLDIQPS